MSPGTVKLFASCRHLICRGVLDNGSPWVKIQKRFDPEHSFLYKRSGLGVGTVPNDYQRRSEERKRNERVERGNSLGWRIGEDEEI